MDLKIGVREADNGVHIVDVDGEIDIYTGPKVRETLTELIERGHSKLVINFERLRYIDSTGLSVFVEGMKRARQHGGAFAFVSTSPQINGIFRITRLDRVFSVFDDEDQATAGLG